MQLIGSNLLSLPITPEQDGSADTLPTEFGLKYCPSMDLIATYPRTLATEKAIVAATKSKTDADTNYYDDDEDEIVVDVYRLNGQKAFTTTIDSKGKSIGITDIAWREDGVILAITTSDSTIRLVNSFSGKIVHTFVALSDRSGRASRQSASSASNESSLAGKRKSASQSIGSRKRQCIPTSLSYSTHFSASGTTRARLLNVSEKQPTVFDDLLSLNADVDELLELDADLPKELANIDVERYLPKLSTLPANGLGEDDVFSTRTSIDAILHADKHNSRSSITDIAAIAQSDANIHIRIFDSFEVGDVDLNHALNLPPGCVFQNIRNIVTHPLTGKLYVLAEARSSNSPTKTKRQGGIEREGFSALHLLSLDMRFLEQSSVALPILATKATQLHNLIRYLRQIEQQLTREVKNAFDLPMRFTRTLEEDLKEQDGDGSTFETSAFHALLTGEVSGKFKEWLVDILGDRGVKRWEKAVAECLDVVRRLMNENWNPAVERAGVAVSRLAGLAASDVFSVDKILLEALRDTIDVMAVIGEDLLQEVNTEILGFAAFINWLKREVEAAGLEDTSEKLDEIRDNSDHSETRKVLKYILERLKNTSVKKYIRDEQVQTMATKNGQDDLNFYNAFRLERKRASERFAPPSMKQLTTRLGTLCDQLFDQLAQQLQENVFAEYICALDGVLDTKVVACRIVHESRCATLCVFVQDAKSKGTLRRLERSFEPNLSKTKTTDITIEKDAEVLDIQWAGDEEVFLLVRTPGMTKVMSMGRTDGEIKIRYTFGSGQDSYAKLGLVPWKIDVNGRKARRTLTVLDEKGRGYGVFDLDSVESELGNDEDETMSG